MKFENIGRKIDSLFTRANIGIDTFIAERAERAHKRKYDALVKEARKAAEFQHEVDKIIKTMGD